MLVIFTPNSEFPTETQLSLSAMWRARNLIGHRSVCNIMLGPRYTLYSIILVFFPWNKPKLHSVIDMNGRVGLKKVSSRRAGAAASSAWKKLAAAGLEQPLARLEKS